MSIHQSLKENGLWDDFCSSGLWSSHAGGGECCGMYERKSWIFFPFPREIKKGLPKPCLCTDWIRCALSHKVKRSRLAHGYVDILCIFTKSQVKCRDVAIMSTVHHLHPSSYSLPTSHSHKVKAGNTPWACHPPRRTHTFHSLQHVSPCVLGNKRLVKLNSDTLSTPEKCELKSNIDQCPGVCGRSFTHG